MLLSAKALMNSRTLRIAPFLFGSGLCALIYQTAWLREFRLIFGASTAATAAVLGIFMAGLGLGSALLGRRSEKAARPLAFYAGLEMLIALSAALTPLWIWAIRHAYLGLGGTMALGMGWGTAVRLGFATLVIGVPTFLMGGTLPAVARAAVGTEDPGRRSLALLYGVNTLGAVSGAVLATFFLFETFGNHATLWLAAGVNAVIGLAAWWTARRMPAALAPAPAKGTPVAPAANPQFVLAASAIVGFAFLLMELVWYRMLSPLLGGSTFTFGLILAVALLGIGLGGVAYALFASVRTRSLQFFGWTCALEALALAVPFALGDWLATLTMLLRPLGTLGFSGYIAGWAVVCAIVVFPASFVAGVQFPMLIALLGSGDESVGSQTGSAYAWNTAGAIAGSLAGGFGILPAFSAPVTWRMVAGLLCALAVIAGFLAERKTGRVLRFLPCAGTAALALWLFTFTGPTAYWRHSQIGVGRTAKYQATPNDLHDFINQARRGVLWEVDGVESSVAMTNSNALAFIVNGKCDGNSRSDAGTTVMCGLIGGILHPHPANVAVVGLGTGSTAGWLAAVPSVRRVDVFEMEPAILRVARECAAVNHDAMSNPKVHVILGDGRESLLTTRQKYDLIVSEPSNPYRAGIASLFTREYYQSAVDRLQTGGLFLQWLQAYEVDNETVRTVYATLASVFPNVETWRTAVGDLLLVGSAQPITSDVPTLRARLAEEPFHSALLNVWRANDLEGFLAHYVANNAVARGVWNQPGVRINTDDRTVLEYAFARGAAVRTRFDLAQFQASARYCKADRPATVNGEIDWASVADQRISMTLTLEDPKDAEVYLTRDQRLRAAAFRAYVEGDLAGALRSWQAQPREPKDLNELTLVAECLANCGDGKAIDYANQLKMSLPTDATAIAARLLFCQEKWDVAVDFLELAFKLHRQQPWASRDLMARTLALAPVVGEHSELAALRLYHAVENPFSSYGNESDRLVAYLGLGTKLDKGEFGQYSLPGVAAMEPHIPWHAGFLEIRAQCYRAMLDPRAPQAQRDLSEFTHHQPLPMSHGRLDDPQPRLSRAE